MTNAGHICDSRACAVILQAVKDVQGIGILSTIGGSGRKHRDDRVDLVSGSAKNFLFGGEGLKTWCVVADLNYEVILKGCKRLHFVR